MDMKGFLVKSWSGPQGTCLPVPALQLQPPLLDLEPRKACGGGKNGKLDKLQVASSLSLLYSGKGPYCGTQVSWRAPQTHDLRSPHVPFLLNPSVCPVTSQPGTLVYWMVIVHTAIVSNYAQKQKS